MKQSTLKTALSAFLVAAHFVILFTVVLLWLNDGFLNEEMTTTLAIIGPFFAAYTTTFVRYLLNSGFYVTMDDRKLPITSVCITFILPAAFVVAVFGAIILQAYGIWLRSFEDFKLLLGILECIFGVYVGLAIYSLFERP